MLLRDASRAEGPVLRALDLTRGFGDGETRITVLHEISLDLYRGQVVLLMGPSGSGKSTLLAILSGLLHPDSGRVVALEQEIWGMSDRQRERFEKLGILQFEAMPDPTELLDEQASLEPLAA